MKVFVSGVCSDITSPSLGIAKSVRLAFPKASIVYVGYSKNGLGVYHEIFDQIEFHPLWDEIQFDVHKKYIQKSLRGCLKRVREIEQQKS